MLALPVPSACVRESPQPTGHAPPGAGVIVAVCVFILTTLLLLGACYFFVNEVRNKPYIHASMLQGVERSLDIRQWYFITSPVASVDGCTQRTVASCQGIVRGVSLCLHRADAL
jgi:hypothetical protein